MRVILGSNSCVSEVKNGEFVESLKPSPTSVKVLAWNRQYFY